MKRILILVILLVFFLFFLFYLGFHITWSNMFSPGELSRAHEELEKRGECKACHTKGRQLDNAKCIVCHKEIKGRLEANAGLHNSASEECILCHSEHHGREYDLYHLDIEDFDHAATGWPLEGVHTLLKCEACHSRDSYLLDKKECVHCHQDIHLGQLVSECHRCHSAKSFRIETYEHKKSEKCPKGQHLQLDCDECHKMDYDHYPSGKGKVIRYIGIDFTCVKCHEDVHDGENGTDCSECHSQETFQMQ